MQSRGWVTTPQSFCTSFELMGPSFKRRGEHSPLALEAPLLFKEGSAELSSDGGGYTLYTIPHAQRGGVWYGVDFSPKYGRIHGL